MPPRPDLLPPEECANCGAAIPKKARSCPECGADERSGWRESSVYDGLDLPAAAFADEVRGPRRPTLRRGLRLYWLLAAGLVLFILGLVTFR